jgi:hypothetical protein
VLIEQARQFLRQRLMVGTPEGVYAPLHFVGIGLAAVEIERFAVETNRRDQTRLALAGIKRVPVGGPIQVDHIARRIRRQYAGAKPLGQRLVQATDVPVGVRRTARARMHARGYVGRNKKAVVRKADQ